MLVIWETNITELQSVHQNRSCIYDAYERYLDIEENKTKCMNAIAVNN